MSESIQSADGKYIIYKQDDGNFVVYKRDGMVPLWDMFSYEAGNAAPYPPAPPPPLFHEMSGRCSHCGEEKDSHYVVQTLPGAQPILICPKGTFA